MSKKNNNTAFKKRSKDDIKNRTVKVFVIILLILSPFWIIAGSSLLAGAFSEPVKISDKKINSSSFVIIETDEMYYPFAFETQYGDYKSYYCIIQNEGKCVVVHFTSTDWNTFGFKEVFNLNKSEQLYKLSQVMSFSGAQNEISSELRTMALEFYNNNIGDDLREENFFSVFHNYMIDVNDKKQVSDGFTNLVFILLAVILGVFYLLKNRKQKN